MDLDEPFIPWIFNQYPGSLSRKDCWRYVREIQDLFVNWKEATQILLSILPTSPVRTQRALHGDWLAPFPFESCDQATFSSGEHKYKHDFKGELVEWCSHVQWHLLPSASLSIHLACPNLQ